jgi:hypothetical protein
MINIQHSRTTALMERKVMFLSMARILSHLYLILCALYTCMVFALIGEFLFYRFSW